MKRVLSIVPPQHSAPAETKGFNARIRGRAAQPRSNGGRRNERGTLATFECRLPPGRKTSAYPRRLPWTADVHTESVLPTLDDHIRALVW